MLLHKDHPRLCGEKLPKRLQIAVGSGSPPPMRGKAAEVTTWYRPDRITPAYAGKSTIFQIKTDIHRDHPRLCGEKPARTFINNDIIGITPAYAGKSQQRLRFRYDQIGSPPPMRGKVLEREQEKNHDRITPAYAGKRRIFTNRKHE